MTTISNSEPVELTEAQKYAARVYIDDAIVMKMYELQRIASTSYEEKRRAREEGRQAGELALLAARSKAQMYKRELKRVNVRHRLLVLEHRELERKYNELMTAGAAVGSVKFEQGYNAGYAAGVLNNDVIPF